MFPSLAQKIYRLIMLLVRLRFLSCGDQLNMSDVLIQSQTVSDTNTEFQLDTSLASRQELLALVSEFGGQLVQIIKTNIISFKSEAGSSRNCSNCNNPIKYHKVILKGCNHIFCYYCASCYEPDRCPICGLQSRSHVELLNDNTTHSQLSD
jgi:hypothetical protein